MALFPAYSASNKEVEDIADSQRSEHSDDFPTESAESQLLASDTDDGAGGCGRESPAQPRRRAGSPVDFYVDRRLDRGNLRVSTLYYPGRPQYTCAGGARAGAEPRARRYFSRRARDAPDAAATAERARAFRGLLARAPHDAALWESFVDFQEACGDADGALAAARDAAAQLPADARLRARLLAAMRRALAPHALLERLRDMLAAERSPRARAELWEALLEALGRAGAADAPQLAAAAAALADTRALPAAYPRLLHAHGAYLRAAGLWERLVLLVELVAAMNLPGAPPADAATDAAAERRLLALEDAARASGLPLGAVWVRVERARGAAHWRPAAPGAALGDPQRAPLPPDVAELLLPVAAPGALLQLAVRLLMLAKVPLLPGTEAAARWAGRLASGAADAEALLPLLAAAAALPPAHRAHAPRDLARRALALLLDPPHYCSDDAGYLRWVEALWDAAARAAGRGALAPACWRLRWLGALLALAEGAEAARLRARARALLRDGPAHPLPFAEFARLELGAGGAERARAAATHALRAALADAALPAAHALFAARAAAAAGAGAGALVCAVLRRAPAAEPRAPEPADVAAALLRCERECDDIEAALEAESASEADAAGEADVGALLLPARGEWARARAALATPRRRAELLRRVRDAAPGAVRRGGAAARYWEESAEALARGGVARALLPLFPHNVRLALESAGAAPWARGAGSAAERLAAPRGDVAALAALLPPLLQALRCDFAPPEAERLARAARRQAARGGGALLWALRLEAEARAPHPRLPRALFAALDAAPHAKWLYVRGAALGADAAPLADALLERQLRLHALPDELREA